MNAVTKRRLRTLAVAAGIGTLLLIGLVGFMAWTLDKPIKVNGDGMVFIPLNASVSDALDSVKKHVHLPTPWLVDLRARMLSRFRGRSIQSGWYTFTSEDSQNDVLDNLFSGTQRSTVRLTIPEGLTYKEIGGLIAAKVESDSAAFVAWCEDSATIARYAPEAPSMEGYLMPDTYEFFWGADAASIGRRLADEWQKRFKDMAPTREHVTMASVVQAEAAVEEEMPRIAGVYANRLERGMKLEADPTVQYALGDKRRLLYRDLDVESPYNTYVVKGLPPGPINNPGEAAVRAALQPELHDYLYFVAKGDESGQHLFAKSGVEHVRNVRKYRQNRERF